MFFLDSVVRHPRNLGFASMRKHWPELNQRSGYNFQSSSDLVMVGKTGGTAVGSPNQVN